MEPPPTRYQKQQENNELSEIQVPHRLGHNVIVSEEDTWTLVGVRGSGKTTFSKQLLPRLRDLYTKSVTYILDTKNQGEFDDIPARVVEGGDAPPPLLNEEGGILIWKYPLTRRNVLSKWFYMILQRGKPAIVIVDELSNVVGATGRDVPDGYVLLLKLGRAAGIIVITGTQEAAYIPRQVLGQTTHLVRFHLQDEFDERKIARLLGFRGAQRYAEPRYPYGFFYKRLDIQGPTYEYRNWQEFFA